MIQVEFKTWLRDSEDTPGQLKVCNKLRKRAFFCFQLFCLDEKEHHHGRELQPLSHAQKANVEREYV